MPHRAELWESLDRVKDVGLEKWYDKMTGLYACSQCATINSAYDIACRKCKTEPSCTFVRRNKPTIIPFRTAVVNIMPQVPIAIANSMMMVRFMTIPPLLDAFSGIRLSFEV